MDSRAESIFKNILCHTIILSFASLLNHENLKDSQLYPKKIDAHGSSPEYGDRPITSA